jgi:hypothetical protein
MAMLDKALANPQSGNIYIDISWTEVAKYVTETPEATANTAAVINKYPDRFLMGTDEVAPSDQASYLKILDMYKPLFDKLTPEAKQKLLKGNYERLFDAARVKVRAWEKAHVNDPKKIHHQLRLQVLKKMKGLFQFKNNKPCYMKIVNNTIGNGYVIIT